MKNWFFMTALIITIITATEISIAADNAAEKPNIPSVRNQIRARGTQPVDPEARLNQMKERKDQELAAVKKAPQALLEQLEEIKTLAKKEKANKTVDLIDKLIEKTKKDMEEKVSTIEARFERMQNVLSNREDRASRIPAARVTSRNNSPANNND